MLKEEETVDFDDVSVSHPDGWEYFASDTYQSEGIVFDYEISVLDVGASSSPFLSTFVAAGGTLPNSMVLTAASFTSLVK